METYELALAFALGMASATIVLGVVIIICALIDLRMTKRRLSQQGEPRGWRVRLNEWSGTQRD